MAALPGGAILGAGRGLGLGKVPGRGEAGLAPGGGVQGDGCGGDGGVVEPGGLPYPPGGEPDPPGGLPYPPGGEPELGRLNPELELVGISALHSSRDCARS